MKKIPSFSTAAAGFLALAVAMGIGRFAFTPILPMMQGEGAIDVVQGGWLASANYVGYFVGAVTATRLPFAAGNALRTGLVLVGASTLLMAFTEAFAAWLALRFAAGVASAWVLVFASAWALERFHRERAAQSAAATLYAGVGAGIAIAGLACIALLVAHATARTAWAVLGVVACVASMALWNRFSDAGAAAPPAGAKTHRGYAWRLVACYGAFGFGYIIPATFIAAMARESFPDPAVYGWSWPIFGAAAAASTFLAARVRQRASERGVWIGGHVVMAAGVAIPVAVESFAGTVVSALLVGGTFMVVTMVGMQEARRVAGANARPLMAAMTSAFAAGQIAGPLAVSFAASHGGRYSHALLFAAATLVLAALVLLPPPSLDSQQDLHRP